MSDGLSGVGSGTTITESSEENCALPPMSREPPFESKPTVVLADGHLIFLELLSAFLSPEFAIVAMVRNGFDLVGEVLRNCPDIVVASVRMPGCSGIEAARRIRKAGGETRFIFLTLDEARVSAAIAFAAGASGYMLKSGTAAELLKAARLVAEGGTYITPAIGRDNIEFFVQPDTGSALTRIPPRQQQVLRLLLGGLSMKTVAKQLGITARTVAFHKYKAMETLGLKNNSELIGFALRHGLLNARHSDEENP